MFGGLDALSPGNLVKTLSGQSDFRASAPTINTKAGTEAIRKQSQMAANRAAANQYSLMASSGGSPLAAREAQRRAAMAGQEGIANASLAQSQLEQGIATENARNQMQAQDINAKIAAQNAGGWQKLAGLGLAGAGMMFGGPAGAAAGGAIAGQQMSDERAKYMLSDKRAKLAAEQFREAFRNLGLSKSPEAQDFIDTAASRLGDDPEHAIRMSLLRAGLSDFDREANQPRLAPAPRVEPVSAPPMAVSPRAQSLRDEFAAAFRNAGMGERSAATQGFLDSARDRLAGIPAPPPPPPAGPSLREQFRQAMLDAGLGQRSATADAFVNDANARLAGEPQAPMLAAGPTNVGRFEDVPAAPSENDRLYLASDERGKLPFATDRYQSALAAGGDDGRRVQWVTGGPDERATVAQHARDAGVDLNAADWRTMGYVPPAGAPEPRKPTAPTYVPMTGRERMGSGMTSLGLALMGGNQVSDARAKVLEDENRGLRGLLTAAITPQPRMLERGVIAPPPSPLDRMGAGVRDETTAAQYGAAWNAANREAAHRDFQEAGRALEAQKRAEAALGEQQALSAERLPRWQDNFAQIRDVRPMTAAEQMRVDEQAQRQGALAKLASSAGMGAASGAATGARVTSDARAKGPTLIIAIGKGKPGDSEECDDSEEMPGGMMGMMSGSDHGNDSEDDSGEDMARMDFPNGVKPVAFEYKDEIVQSGLGKPGKHVGVLAQDVEKSPEGATVVEEDPATGLKMLDVGGLSALNTAKLSEIENRLDALETKPKAKPKRRATGKKGKG